MKSAYLYVRVSTDEQKKKGYSLIEQEDRLLNYCKDNNIKVKGIIKEDYSAKDFNRPEWSRLIKAIKKNRHRPSESILFIKWDRFSRNIAYAYQMIGILGNLNVQAMAIDQPIDFEVPESTVMLAVYLSIPEAENMRRGKNTADGMRRARKMGRWPGRAPIGYINQTAPDGKKSIVPKQPEADHIKWAFQQFAQGSYSISQVRKIATLRGFKCGRNNFWCMLHNPVYCGLVTVAASKTEPVQFVKGVHEPLISEKLFQDIQMLLQSRCRQKTKKESLKHRFPLRGFLICPYCNCKMSGSISKGRSLYYRYYHCCTSKCRGRFRAEILEEIYETQLKKILIMPAVSELFELVLEDENIFSVRKSLLNEQTIAVNGISEQQLLFSKARRLLLDGKIDFEDFNKMKNELKRDLDTLNDRLLNINTRLTINNLNANNRNDTQSSIFDSYKNQDITGKRNILNLFSPTLINPFTGTFSLQINPAISKIIYHKGSNI